MRSASYAICLIIIYLFMPLCAYAEEFKDVYEKAKNSFLSNRYRDAAVAYDEAFRLKPLPTLMLMKGKCYQRLGEHAGAILAFEKFLKMNPAADKRDEAQRLLGLARQQIVLLPPGADTALAEPGLASLAPAVDAAASTSTSTSTSNPGPGPTVAETEPGGRPPAAQTPAPATSSGSGSGSGSGGDAAPARGPRERHRMSGGFWWGIGLTGTLGVASAIAGGLALSGASSLQKRVFTPDDESELQPQRDSVHEDAAH